jgi:hypothetical protein
MPEATTGLHGIPKFLLPPATCLAAFFLLASALLLCPARASSQVAPSAYDSSRNIWAGAEYSNFLPDFGPPQRLSGIGVYVDLNVTSRLGVEGEARFQRFNGFYGESQDNYLIGPEVILLHRGKLRPYAKVLFGIGQNDFPLTIGTGKYFILAPGGGVDYRLSRRISLRAEYEYQFWPSAPGVAGEPSNGMKPNGFSAGFAYKLFGR